MRKLFRIVLLAAMAILLTSCSFVNRMFPEKIDPDTLNYISTVVLNSNLKIKTVTYTKLFNTEIPGPYTGTGSGVIIKKQDNFYYLLTNQHVVMLSVDYSHRYIVEDVYNNVTAATLVASDEAYDLAVLKFESTEDMHVMELATSNPIVGELVFSIGSPSGKHNIITAGKILSYNTINNVDYEIIVHDAVIRYGSSGSMLINDSFEIVGLNTWGFDDDETTVEEYVVGGATPTEKIIEFLEANGFTVE